MKAQEIINLAKKEAEEVGILFPSSYALGVIIAKYDSLLYDYEQLKEKLTKIEKL